ncbi:MAG: prealbumin-like fold domain-containing protein, partial [Oscillospiraceae bacterium]|nr:prealbumin-like fold domain-containing protein [Oscillospiraceae bacterium]
TITNVVYNNGTFTITNVANTPVTAEIVVSKIDDSGSNLAGAEFTLTATSGGQAVDLSGVTVTNAASSSYSNYTVTFTTGTSDITLTGLPDGTYTLTESAMSGYTTVDPVTFTVSSSVVTYNSTITNVVYNNGTFTITNVAIPVQTASITIRKSYEDAAGNALSDSEASALEATFTLISDSTTSTPSYSETITITGNSTGTFDNLDYNGTYILSEASPTGYTATSPSGFPLTLNITSGVLGNGFSNNTVYVTNTATTTTTTNTVTVSKRDMSNAVINTTDGSVATFTITGTGLDGVTIEVDGTTNTISGTSYTFSGTDAIFTDLPNGTYTLTEVAAPTGYEVVSTFTFTVTDGVVTVNSSTTTGDVKVNGTQIIVMDEVIASTGSGTSSTTTTTATSVTSDTTSATTSIVTTVTTIKPYTEPGWAQSFWAIATAHTTAEAVTIPEISEENPADLVSETVDAGAGIHSDSEESLIDESSPVTTVAVGSLAAALSALVMVLCRKFGKKTQKGAHSK